MTVTVRRRTGWDGFSSFGRLFPPAVTQQASEATGAQVRADDLTNSARWKIAGLIALVTFILLLYAASGSWLRALIVLSAVRFGAADAIWFL